MRKPKLHLAFDLANDKGMSSVLSGKSTWQEVVLHTPQEDIDVIPAGPPPPNPAELLMRPAFDQILRDLHEVYDIIVIDSPPVGLVTDGIIIMQKADLPIYVVRSEYSKRVYLKNINKLVKANGFRSLGVIMNGLDKLKTYGYGYGYGYGYSSSYGQGYGYGYGSEYFDKEAPRRRWSWKSIKRWFKLK
jgi:capsular exopolysaccharide synthesis family protein